MKKLLHQINEFLNSNLKSYVPRWIILFIDLFIVASSYTLLWIFRDSIGHHQSGFFVLKLVIVLFLYLASSVIYKTYHGVVRFTSLNDLRRVGYSTILVLISFEIISFVWNTFILNGQDFDKNLFPHFNYWVPPIFAAITFTFQILFRFSIRAVFEYFKLGAYRQDIYRTSNKKRVYILGSDYDSLLLTSSILSDSNSIFEPVAYVTFNNNAAGKSLGGLQIINGSNGLRKYSATFGAETLLIYRSQIKSTPKTFFDNCIADSIEILVVNSFDKFDDSEKESVVPRIDRIKIDDLLWRDVIYLDKSEHKDKFKNKTILVTGGAGSIGSEIVRQLCQLNCARIVVIDEAESPMYELWFEMKKSLGSSELIPLIGNVTNKKEMAGFFEKYRPNIVYHAAAYKHVPLMELQPAVAIFNNIGGTKNLADLSVEFGVEKFIMVSTDKAVNPTNVMGATKRASEIYIQTLNNRLLAEGVQNPTQFVTTRFGNVLGSNGSVVQLFKRQIENGGPVTVTHRDITRYFMTIPEACSLVLEASCTGTGGQIYIFDMGKPVKIYDLAEKMIRLAGKKPGRDIEIHETGLRPGEKLYEELLANSENTIPTANKKIMIAKVRTYDYKEVDPKISKLIEASQTNGSTFVIVKLLKNLIPEYISHNSVFEQLD